MPSAIRQFVDFLVILLVSILVTRTFLAEAYIVPTGSMAPTLLGIHLTYSCPNCHSRFALGVDESGQSGQPVCSNCGLETWDDQNGVPGSGDRLLVQKFLFDIRPPRRWEAVVFQNPADPTQAYVKRVVGLPGESIEIRDGDVWINGEIARKSLEEQRALRILVYDNTHLPADHGRYPRWGFRRGGPRFARPASAWSIEEGELVRRPDTEAPWRVDWAEYRHWQPDRGGYGPIRDFIPYNGRGLRGENRVNDLMIEAKVLADPDIEAMVLRLGPGSDQFHITIPVDRKGPLRVLRNGRSLPIWETGVELRSAIGKNSRPATIEASLIDRRLIVTIDGELAFEPIDFESVPPGPSAGEDRPVAIGVLGPGGARISSFRLYRDIYYTDALLGAPRHPYAVGTPYALGPGEFFVLGDNSPVSNDSRFWQESPVVRRELFLGKPFLVHLPSQAVPLQVFGHEVYWIPDPREIRYIR